MQNVWACGWEGGVAWFSGSQEAPPTVPRLPPSLAKPWRASQTLGSQGVLILKPDIPWHVCNTFLFPQQTWYSWATYWAQGIISLFLFFLEAALTETLGRVERELGQPRFSSHIFRWWNKAFGQVVEPTQAAATSSVTWRMTRTPAWAGDSQQQMKGSR